MSREFVDKVADGDNISAKDVFTSAIVSKVGATLELKRGEVAKTFVQQRQEMTPDEVKKETE
jgi:hypothetical protein